MQVGYKVPAAVQCLPNHSWVGWKLLPVWGLTAHCTEPTTEVWITQSKSILHYKQQVQ